MYGKVKQCNLKGCRKTHNNMKEIIISILKFILSKLEKDKKNENAPLDMKLEKREY